MEAEEEEEYEDAEEEPQVVEKDEVVEEEEEGEVIVEEEEHSVHALSSLSLLSTIRIRGRVGKMPTEILVDSGSTNNFIDKSVVSSYDSMVTKTMPLLISIANGDKIESTAMCPTFSWVMQGKTFTAS
ncbi:hypothetical protein Droror1_Dr00000216, partial [Drosera rotundifolia]